MLRLLAPALVVLVAAGCGGHKQQTISAPPEQLVLQLRDLPRGYAYGDDSGCGEAAATEGDWPQLEPLFASERPAACSMEIEWRWQGKPKYSRAVTSAAYVFRNEEGAQRAFAARDELAAFTASLSARTHENLELGDAAELLGGRGLNDPASGVVWRDRNVVALVVAEPADDGAAEALARKQATRIRRPAPPPELRRRDRKREPRHWRRRPPAARR